MALFLSALLGHGNFGGCHDRDRQMTFRQNCYSHSVHASRQDVASVWAPWFPKGVFQNIVISIMI